MEKNIGKECEKNEIFMNCYFFKFILKYIYEFKIFF